MATLSAGLMTSPAATAHMPEVPASEEAAGLHMSGDPVVLPFQVVREFPFVEAEVNGVKGKLMLDTGALGSLSLNHNHLNLPEGRVTGRGNFASGQTFDIILRPSVEKVRLAGGLSFDHVTNVTSQDASQLERITPDFLCWLGHEFWAGYAAKFDYGASTATFYQSGPAAFLQGETVVAAIPFELRNRPNIPVLIVRIGDTDFPTVLDTGQNGYLFADASTLERLSAMGAISFAQGAKTTVDIKTLRFSKGPVISVPGIEVHRVEDAVPFAKAVALPSPQILMLGYAFLRQYKTAWDYPNRTLYLLKP